MPQYSVAYGKSEEVFKCFYNALWLYDRSNSE